MKQVVVLFGESEKGAFKVPHAPKQLPDLLDLLGHPPQESQGLSFAVQTLLYNRELIYFRVSEEGFSALDYFNGLRYIQDREKVNHVTAICMPGVGDPDILDFTTGICQIHKSLLITSQKDLYDFLTSYSWH